MKQPIVQGRLPREDDESVTGGCPALLVACVPSGEYASAFMRGWVASIGAWVVTVLATAPESKRVLVNLVGFGVPQLALCVWFLVIAKQVRRGLKLKLALSVIVGYQVFGCPVLLAALFGYGAASNIAWVLVVWCIQFAFGGVSAFVLLRQLRQGMRA